MAALQAVPTHVRSWRAKEEFLTWDQFAVQLQSAPYAVLLDCQEWRVSVPSQ